MKKLIFLILLILSISSISNAQYYPYIPRLTNLSNTWDSTQIFDSIYSKSIRLPYTYNNTLGIIWKDSDWFLHNFSNTVHGGLIPTGGNTFLGVQAGNFTMGSTITQSRETQIDITVRVPVPGASIQDSTTMNSSHPQSTYLSSANTGIGTYSLRNLTLGFSNSALGYGSLYNVTEGSSNVSLGAYSLYSLTTGTYNTGIGTLSLYNLTTGSNNIALGHLSGTNNNYGNSNYSLTKSIYIGSQTKSKADSVENEIVIGYYAVGNGNNTTTIGNNNVTTTYIKGNISNDSTITTSAYKQKSVVTISDSTINCNLSNAFQKTLGATQRFVFTNFGDGQTINIAVTNTASNYTVTWVGPAGLTIKWTGGITPVQTIGAKTDIWTFIRFGTTIYGNVVQDF